VQLGRRGVERLLVSWLWGPVSIWKAIDNLEVFEYIFLERTGSSFVCGLFFARYSTGKSCLRMFDWVSLILLLLYASLLGVGCHQLRTTMRSRNKRVTIRNGIVSILTLSVALRAVFWLKACVPTTMNAAFGMLIFFLPVWMNFAGLSLLVVFYSQIIHAGSKTPMRLCIFANFCLFTTNLIIVGELADTSDGNDAVEQSNALLAYAIFGPLLDFTLASLLAYYGQRFKAASKRSVLTTRIQPSSLFIFDVVNWIIIVAYLFRGIFTALLSSGKVLPLNQGSVAFQGEHAVTSATTFFFFLIAEIVPCSCVFAMLWKVSSSSQGKLNHGVETLQRHDGSEKSTLDTRLLSVEDSKVKIFISADNNKTASLEEEEGTYLLFEDSLSPPNPLVQEEGRDEDNQIPGPVPIPKKTPTFHSSSSSSSEVESSSLVQSPMLPSSLGSYWAARLSFSGAGGKPPTPGSRDPTPDLNTYTYLHHDGGSAPDGAAVIDVQPPPHTITDRERYSNTISPRDILLKSSDRRRSIPK